MKGAISAALGSRLLRILESEPTIRIEDAIARVVQVTTSTSTALASFNTGEIESHLAKLSKRYHHQGVINPKWLAFNAFLPHFFLINAPPGWLDTLMQLSGEKHARTSQYIVYGDWDSLLILYGTKDEAERQLGLIAPTLRQEAHRFSASRVPYIYRYRSGDYQSVDKITRKRVNEVALAYDSPKRVGDRQALEEAGVLLGPVWKPDEIPPERVIAFTGINVVGHAQLTGDDLLNMLLQKDVLQRSLVHLFEVEQGRPFHFFAKLSCDNMAELDEATNMISLPHFGHIRLEGSTVVVASGVDTLPTLREATPLSLGTRPLVEDIESLAKNLVGRFGAEAVASFNEFAPDRKLAVLRALERVSEAVALGGWEEEWAPKFLTSADSFGRTVLERTIPGRITGPVMEAATAVEAAVKRAVRGLVEKVFGVDFALAQNRLKLPTKNLRRLSLGKATEALRQAAADKRFGAYSDALSSDSMDRLEQFTNYRNAWAHGEPPWESDLDIIDHGSRALVYGMAIARWAALELPLPPKRRGGDTTVEGSRKIHLQEKPSGRVAGSFLSYSSEDKATAARIATALDAMGERVWYDWEIGPGDSIGVKIEEGLARHDTLIILLSPASVKSKWVRRELDTALMDQLAGHDVKIIPALVAPCKLPAFLKSIKYVDFTSSFQDGVIQLVQTLSTRGGEA